VDFFFMEALPESRSQELTRPQRNLHRGGPPITSAIRSSPSGVGKGGAYDVYPARALKAAKIVRVPTLLAGVDAFLAQGADVAAGVKPQLEADAARLDGLRLLPGRFMVLKRAMGVPANRGEAAARALARFVEPAKFSGLVARALACHGIEGATVAPAA
jgi:polar amino acid transport system substrate-binding protein